MATQTDVWHGGDIALSTIERVTDVVMYKAMAAKSCVVKVVMVEEKDPEMEKGLMMMYRDRIPELASTQEDYEVIEQLTKLRSLGPDHYVSKKIIKINLKGSEEDAWHKIRRVKEETVEAELVAIHQIQGMSLERFRKLTECIFHGTSTKIAIYTPRETKSTTVALAKDRERKTYALVVDNAGKDYRETLSKVKENTWEGKLLITTDKNSEALEEIQRALVNSDDDIRTYKLGERANMEIRGLDAATDKEEVIEAIKNKIGSIQGKTIKLVILGKTLGALRQSHCRLTE
ncbi:hypothetical protein NQ314_011234 [Rhamnusium bicolor]|uniref:Uncharacterized protein n=1 Tax=Rhamnusium bicolor TaxID=1586634 RepID=A0AAV8XKX1_9CUCU|nr:hypothetical protein NQ314_011234 [Rhamnusium bicolor]